MAGEITLPGVGPVNKKLLIGGAGVVALLAIVMYYRKQKANSAAAVASSNTAQTDPETGYPEGSPEDQAALAALAASAQTGGVYGGSSGTATSPTVPAGTGITTNAQWEQDAVDYLTNTVQMVPATVSSALGAYLAGSPLTMDQTDIVHQAIAAEGPPPVAAADSYPPNLRPVETTPPPTGGGGTGGGGGNSTTGPGPWSITAIPLGPTEIDLSWVSQGSQYTSYLIQYGQDGKLNFNYTVFGTSAKIGALHGNTLWAFRIIAKGPGGESAPSPVMALSTPA